MSKIPSIFIAILLFAYLQNISSYVVVEEHISYLVLRLKPQQQTNSSDSIKRSKCFYCLAPCEVEIEDECIFDSDCLTLTDKNGYKSKACINGSDPLVARKCKEFNDSFGNCTICHGDFCNSDNATVTKTLHTAPSGQSTLDHVFAVKALILIIPLMILAN